MRVAVVYHCEQTTSRLDEELAAAGADVERFRLHAGDPVPANGSFDRVVVLGGDMGAYEDEAHPWMRVEKDWMVDLVSRDVPVLGICLGSQLLAAALGGRAFPSPTAEANVVELRLTPAGEADPTLRAAAPTVFALHGDTFEVPPEATLLATTDGYPHAFRLGSALAVQFHPDADLEQASRWGKEASGLLARAGVDYGPYSESLRAVDPILDERSRAFFRAWLRES